ncbi:hypothetical protein POM88_027985 [Heracleum sosnowskyi]|uniref:Uncharacterized protein n=1 Tax=Heracleum sosnowskyi TaxID=360622 RepID=A0AAD8MQ18_9APIA|nr:hypothetical protein POM88_027985 [Heracleum sosnowskyi]
MDKIKRWRTALTQVANLGGMPSQNVANGYESKLIQKIVNVVKNKVICKTLNMTQHPVGIGPSVQDISSWLRNGSTDVEVFALYGVGGLGKTTIAKYVYNMNFRLFEGDSFLENIREYSERSDGLVCLQRQLLSDISKGKTPKIKNLNDGILKIKSALHQRKLLIVLDDVDQVEQLDAVFGQRSRLWYYKDSLQVLRDETGTKAIEGLALEMNTSNVYQEELRTKAFSMMHKLRLLKLNNVQLSGVAIDMQSSKLQKLGQENMLLGSLKFLNLSHCHGIVKSPDFAKLSALEHLDCILLKKLPEKFCTLKVLETLIISGCSNLSMLPAEMRTMESLKVFHADGLDFGDSNCTAHQNKSWREYIWGLVSVPKVSPQLSLASLPCNSITRLSLANCNLHDNSFPVDFRVAHSLEFLNLSNNPIRFLPDCFKGLKEVKIFRLHNCNQLQTLEDLPQILDFFTIDCPLLEKITFKPGLSLKSFAFPYKCENLLEMVDLFKIVPIENMDSELINSCGISDVEPMKSIQIRLYNRFTSTETKCSIQGVFEDQRRQACYGIPEGGEYMKWLSHWRFGSHDMGPGDEVNISIFNYHDDQNFEVKEIGVYLVYEEQEQAGCYGIPEGGEYMTWLSHWRFGSHEMGPGDEMASDRSWMNRRFDANKKITDDYKIGVEDFIRYAVARTEDSKGRIRCPCTECGNYYIKYPDDVILDLYRHGIMPGYTTWSSHGESDRSRDDTRTSSRNVGNIHDDFYDAREMLEDFVEANRHFQNVEEEPTTSDSSNDDFFQNEVSNSSSSHVERVVIHDGSNFFIDLRNFENDYSVHEDNEPQKDDEDISVDEQSGSENDDDDNDDLI